MKIVCTLQKCPFFSLLNSVVVAVKHINKQKETRAGPQKEEPRNAVEEVGDSSNAVKEVAYYPYSRNAVKEVANSSDSFNAVKEVAHSSDSFNAVKEVVHSSDSSNALKEDVHSPYSQNAVKVGDSLNPETQ